jgi:hypothetical protein
MNAKTVILVDVENFNGKKDIDTILSFYTKTTKFAFFSSTNSLLKRHKAIKEFFKKCPEQMYDGFTFDRTYANRADFMLTHYAGINLMDWRDAGVENIIIFTDDHFSVTVALMLKNYFRVWLGRRNFDSPHVNVLKQDGIHIPMIRIKYGS